MTPRLKRKEEEELYKLFYKEKNLFGRDRLFQLAKERGINVSRRQIMEWLKTQEIWQLYKQAKNPKDIQSTILGEPYKQIGIDLVDMQNLAFDGFNYILTGIDLFSKKAWAIPLKSKATTNVVNGMKKMISQFDQTPSSIRSDNGSEFISKQFKALMKRKGIRQVFSLPAKPQSNGEIERFNGTLKRMIVMELAIDNTSNWVKDLDLLVNNYNETISSVTKKAPNKIKKEDFKEIKENITKAVVPKNKKLESDLKVNDRVRHRVTDKRNKSVWSKEIYRIEKILQPRKAGSKKFYRLKNLKPKFLEENLQKIGVVANPLNFERKLEVSKLVRPSFQGGEAGYIVRWKGFSSKFDTWEPRSILNEDIPKFVKKFDKKHNVVFKDTTFSWDP